MHFSKVIQTIPLAEGTIGIEVEKPDGYKFRAGQHAAFELIHPSDEQQNDWRPLTIASAPHEENLLFATRLKAESPFKRKLKNLKPGEFVMISDSDGKFIVPEDEDKEIILITGGIGATPLRSIVADQIHRGHPNSITAFDFNRTPKDAPFHNTPDIIQEDKLTMVPVMTQANDDWSGKTGYFSDELIDEYVKNPEDAYWMVAGPEKTVDSVVSRLHKRGIPHHRIETDEFPGY